jgi:PTH1 family peptidyl-tRNA hydrolase
MGSDRFAAKFQGSLSEGKFGSEKVLLLKPETFMNLSGQSVGEAMRFYKLTPGDVTVFHDELDLAPGKVRVKQGGGHAGHNGLRSIHQHIGEAYGRVRLGSGIRATRTAWRATSCRISPRPMRIGSTTCCAASPTARRTWPQGDSGRFLNAVSMRTAPARNAKPAEAKDTPSPAGAAEARRPLGASETRGPVPMSETAARVRGAFRSQGKSCALLGSPFMGRLMPLIGERLTAETGVGARILGWEGDVGPAGQSVPLRTAGALHALVLDEPRSRAGGRLSARGRGR